MRKLVGCRGTTKGKCPTSLIIQLLCIGVLIYLLYGHPYATIEDLCLFGERNREFIKNLTFPDFPLQIGLIVYHFRYNVGYQTYLVLLAKYLLHHAKSFSAFSVTFAAEMRIISRSTNEQLLSINLKSKAYEKDFYFDCCCLDGSRC